MLFLGKLAGTLHQEVQQIKHTITVITLNTSLWMMNMTEKDILTLPWACASALSRCLVNVA